MQYVSNPQSPPVAVAGGHLWCARCATAALPKQRQCPRCGDPCLSEPAASPAARLVVAAMSARCPWRCGWAGPLGALDAHWAQCGREAVARAVAGCGATVARSEMAAHIAGALAQHLCALAKVTLPACLGTVRWDAYVRLLDANLPRHGRCMQARDAATQSVAELRNAMTEGRSENAALRADYTALRGEMVTLRSELSAQHDELAELNRAAQALAAGGAAAGPASAHGQSGTPGGAAAPARLPAPPPQPPLSAPAVNRAAAPPPPPATPTVPPSDGRACAHAYARGEWACVYTCPL